MNTAFLLLDAQVNMFGPEYPVYDSVALLQRLVALLERARRACVPVIFVQHAGGPGDIDEPGEPGFDIQPELAPLPGDTIVVKRTPSAFNETTLQAGLENLGVTKLILAGMQSDLCIDATCRAAAALGYAVTLVADAHSTYASSSETAPESIARVNGELSGLLDVISMKDLIFSDREISDPSSKE